MSLFRYKVILSSGKEKNNRVTAKNEAAARTRVANLNQVKEWIWIKEEKPAAPPIQPRKPAAAIKPTVAKSIAVSSPKAVPPPPAAATTVIPPKPTTKLEKLLYRQDWQCFFCGRTLTKEEASIEHLQPKSAGGKNDDGNVVACCVALNRTMGNMSLKEKVQMVLKKSGHFTCPA
ncbi:MAG TPA: HNH endonuclease [Lacunisphaera sp.]